VGPRWEHEKTKQQDESARMDVVKMIKNARAQRRNPID
jgi:hypothetical protein